MDALDVHSILEYQSSKLLRPGLCANLRPVPAPITDLCGSGPTRPGGRRRTPGEGADPRIRKLTGLNAGGRSNTCGRRLRGIASDRACRHRAARRATLHRGECMHVGTGVCSASCRTSLRRARPRSVVHGAHRVGYAIHPNGKSDVNRRNARNLTQRQIPGITRRSRCADGTRHHKGSRRRR